MESSTPPDSPAPTEDGPSGAGSAPTSAEAETPDTSASGDAGVGRDEPAESADSFENRMPDPSSLVAMAAMHLSTSALLPVLLAVFDHHAWRSIGLLADHTGEAKKDLPSAQLAIDCYAFVLSKIEASLDEPERRDAQRRLTDLRMNYVAKTREG
ncbi:MAG TPA: DUF1844 domain-containing protein [Chthonomonadaceae bacterium]|nr:DUF1844 domain-containing protein [Chthonomonadaceae bacterium]